MKNDLQLSHADIACPNCGTVIAGKFCQGCSQPAHLHVPSAREFLHEFIAHYVALEGKLWKSVALLLFRPGRLTRDYIEGKRVRYVEPLRLYLSFSIIFFAIFKLGGVHLGDGTADAPSAGKAEVSVQQTAGTPRNATVEAAARAREQARQQEREERRRARPKNQDGDVITLDEGDDAKAEKFAASIHPALGKKVAHFFQLPEKERKDALLRALSSYTPYAIFALMPVFAALLKLLYLGSGRRYGEHLLFALHTNAFAFLALSLWLLVPDVVPLVGFGLWVWLVFYLPTAMRKVYGGSRLLTALRWIVLMTLHLFCIAMAIAAAAALAVIA
ncbi:DUF3667 domain-containing protein [Massilia sp. Mn16-1_5]|uniref:DUF3667 domain-containing protein n=1 Tax=Massilia sp. Mn16-1_5 TaxID=2079199 RepID=UPI00109E6828|nr:DUF3667 domain-containing protein [Massilia sp. Mn16-1_5]THC41012.1 hypothetical protein C2862_19795 [Massilia sp. Mn16-1_5]